MGYRAVRIPLSCGEAEIRRWAGYMLAHMDEVAESLRREGVRHEAWHLCPGDPLCLVGVMDHTDPEQAARAMAASALSVDEVHRAFKRHWIRPDITRLDYDPEASDPFPGCELLFEARP
ncbi:DUF6176 family protein [Poseidonocella sp. HB161398]|uniref:DUF6176 family protein n=1 Tax=Poseidonocella sp. HB161398 TaxID=2320855 RepID=UPI001109F196|nr:DUF6176 family protein [Poseidonocella sp. HB161398]